jgi:hypothetical protein
MERPFDLNTLKVESPNFFFKSLDAKVVERRSSMKSVAGHFDPKDTSIHINNNMIKRGLAHEIKHLKFNDIFDTGIIGEWLKLAKDSSGKSVYFNDLDIKGKASLESASPENFKLGFITNYARRNFWEDIAEICNEAEDSVRNKHYLKKLDNPLIKKKTELAVKYKLLSKGFFEYSDLVSQQYKLNENAIKDWKTGKFEFYRAQISDALKYLKESKDFLNKHQNSIYTIDVRFDRANTIMKLGRTLGHGMEDEAIIEYEKGLKAGYKNKVLYRATLERLRDIYKEKGQSIHFEKYSTAIKKFDERKKVDGVRLSIDGVNDYLEQMLK